VYEVSQEKKSVWFRLLEMDLIAQLTTGESPQSAGGKWQIPHGEALVKLLASQPRRVFVDQEFFTALLWPDLVAQWKGQTGRKSHTLTALMVWNEIVTFLKGSKAALESPTGYLAEDDYLSLADKIAPIFSSKRKDIYQLFLFYQQTLTAIHGYDLTDALHSLYHQALAHRPAPQPCSLLIGP